VTYPAHSQQALPLDTTFTWNASTGATTYRAQIVADSLTGSIIIDTTGITATSLDVTTLQNYHTYYFRLTAMHAAIESGIWAERQFRTIVSTPLQVFPPDREEQVALPVGFGWGFEQGADSYQLQVAADTGFSSLVINKSITDSVTIDTSAGLATSTKYFWRVSASGDGGTTDFSTIRSFTTASVDSTATRYYVKTTGNDGLTGTSWGTAFATIQQALSAAGAGSEIWVAAGTYKPTSTLDRSISFQLKNGVAVYGGFDGTEGSLGQRDWQTNVTILSGDIDGDATLANNSYHVVVGNTFATARLDGFTIIGGNADGGQRGGGIYCSSGYPVLSNLIVSNNSASDFGGGMYNILGNPTLSNVTFTGNQSGDHGGGMHNERGTPSLTNCTFTSNNAIDGAGMSNGTSFYPGSSNAVFTNVVFKNNSSTHFGGGLYTEYAAPVFTNVLFHQNSSGSGGGIYNTQGNSSFANVTFSNNSASNSLPGGGGGGMFVWLSQVVLRNVILWGNAGSPLFNGQVYNGMTSKVTLYNSLIQDGIPVNGGSGIVNFFSGVDADSGGNVSSDPLFLNAGTGDLRLTATSPAIDIGNNEAVTTLLDPNGNPRIVSGNVDMGAYEFQAATISFAGAISRNDSTSQLGSTKVEVEFAGIAPGKSVLVFSNHYETAPDSVTFNGPAPAHFSPFRWVITKAGDLFATAVLSLENVSSYPGVVDPSTLVIYRRSTAGTGEFSALSSTYDSGSDRLTATITSFSEFMIGSNNNTLPAQMSSFTATANRLNAELKWRTETEVDNYGFEIERRFIGSSGDRDNGASAQRGDEEINQLTTHQLTSWSRIGFVKGSGTSTSPKEYSYPDRRLPSGRYAYRIKQIDNSGAFRYTEAVEVEVGLAPRVFTLSQNYPNPFNPTTTIEFTLPEDGRVKMRVYNMLGEEVTTLVDEERKAGVYQQALFDASRLATGVYFSRIEFNGKQLIKKMMLLK
jgi:predicted outer membrane repeat protein